MVRIPTHREPTHPGEMLLEEFLIPMNITQRELAKELKTIRSLRMNGSLVHS
jgi:antitoxin HigA-1